MKSKTKNTTVITAAILSLVIAGTADARSYKFHVSCSNKRLVAEWGIGSIDPGKEFLRVSTGTKYPGCSVSDYNHGSDHSLPIERYSDANAVINGIPVLGPLLDAIF